MFAKVTQWCFFFHSETIRIRYVLVIHEEMYGIYVLLFEWTRCSHKKPIDILYWHTVLTYRVATRPVLNGTSRLSRFRPVFSSKSRFHFSRFFFFQNFNRHVQDDSDLPVTFEIETAALYQIFGNHNHDILRIN